MTKTLGIGRWAIAAALALPMAGVQAAPNTGMGDWYAPAPGTGTLEGRDANGAPVDLLVGGLPNPAVVFVYDSKAKVTWLADWNNKEGQPNPGSPAGFYDWFQADAWASALSFTVGGTVFNDWRLPIAEFASLWSSRLGNIAALDNTGPFSNLNADGYWTGTQPFPLVSSPVSAFDYGAYAFSTIDGTVGDWTAAFQWDAVALRDGDVLASAVPEPATLAMLLTGIGILGWTARRKASAGSSSTLAS